MSIFILFSGAQFRSFEPFAVLRILYDFNSLKAFLEE